jgi:hypothetical protein
MKRFDLEKIFEILSTALRCPICDYKYNLENTSIVESKQENAAQMSLLIHSNCAKCKSNVVFSVAITGPEIFSVGMVTDLTSVDTKRFADQEPITSSEIVGLHDFLHEFNGDFISVLGKNPKA